MSRRTNAYWLRKAKLWCVLHGENLNTTNQKGVFCAVCPHHVYINGITHCKKRENKESRLMFNIAQSKLSTNHTFFTHNNRCLEWVKHV